jgi:hypothetical protein
MRLKWTAAALGVGIALTVIPFFIPSAWTTLEFFHWPLLFVDRHFNSWVPLNPGKRVMTLLLVNVSIWTLLTSLLLFSYRVIGRKGTS